MTGGMPQPLTPDEDAVLGEVIGTQNFEWSTVRRRELSKRCNMSEDRVQNALATLHNKGMIYIPMPGETDIRLYSWTCTRCNYNFVQVVGSVAHTLVCPLCMKNDGIMVMHEVKP